MSSYGADRESGGRGETPRVDPKARRRRRFGTSLHPRLNNIRSAISDDEGASGPEVAASRAGGKFCAESTNEWATMIVNN